MGTKTVRHQCCGQTFVVSPQLGGLFFNLFLQTLVIAIVGARLYAFILAFLHLCIAFPLAYRVLLLLLFFLFDFAALHVHMKCERVLSSKLKNEFENYSFSSPFLSFPFLSPSPSPFTSPSLPFDSLPWIAREVHPALLACVIPTTVLGFAATLRTAFTDPGILPPCEDPIGTPETISVAVETTANTADDQERSSTPLLTSNAKHLELNHVKSENRSEQEKKEIPKSISFFKSFIFIFVYIVYVYIIFYCT